MKNWGDLQHSANYDEAEGLGIHTTMVAVVVLLLGRSWKCVEEVSRSRDQQCTTIC